MSSSDTAPTRTTLGGLTVQSTIVLASGACPSSPRVPASSARPTRSPSCSTAPPSSNYGEFHPVDPARVYDSRRPLPLPALGTLGTGLNRLVSVADSRNITSGAVIASNIVPSNAVAIAANVTVTASTGTGYLSINPGGNTTVSASTINWFGSSQTLANGVILTLNANREITVICGGTASATHFLIDVTGYFL